MTMFLKILFAFNSRPVVLWCWFAICCSVPYLVCFCLSNYIILCCVFYYITLGRVGDFSFFRLFNSIFFFINWISLNFFPFLLKYYHIMFIIIGFWFGSDRPSRLLSFVPALLLSIFTPSTYRLRLFILFHSCCFHARVFGKTLVHELSISYSHAEWYLLFSRNDMIETIEASPVKN